MDAQRRGVHTDVKHFILGFMTVLFIGALVFFAIWKWLDHVEAKFIAGCA